MHTLYLIHVSIDFIWIGNGNVGSSNNGPIIGGVVGGIAGAIIVLAIIFVVVYCCICHKRGTYVRMCVCMY